MVKFLIERNAELIIRKNIVILEEYNQTLPLKEVMCTLIYARLFTSFSC